METMPHAKEESENIIAHSVNVFDRPSAIFAAVVLGFAGTGVAMGMPLLVGSMAKSLGFSEQQLGWLASSDMAGLFFVGCLRVLKHVKRKRNNTCCGGK